MLHEYASTNPMAFVASEADYVSMSEKLHLHVPESVEIKDAVGRLTSEERLYILRRALAGVGACADTQIDAGGFAAMAVGLAAGTVVARRNREVGARRR